MPVTLLFCLKIQLSGYHLFTSRIENNDENTGMLVLSICQITANCIHLLDKLISLSRKAFITFRCKKDVCTNNDERKKQKKVANHFQFQCYNPSAKGERYFRSLSNGNMSHTNYQLCYLRGDKNQNFLMKV